MTNKGNPRGLGALADGILAQHQDRAATIVPPAADTAAAKAGVESIQSTLDWLLSPEKSLERAVERLGLEMVVLTLARQHGVKAIRDALAKGTGGQEKKPEVHAVRHALTLFCQKMGCVSDAEIGRELAVTFPSARGSSRHQRAESLRKLATVAHAKCADDPLGLKLAEEMSDEWAAKYKDKPLRNALGVLTRRWKTNPYP